MKLRKYGEMPPNSEVPFNDIDIPKSIAPVPMPEKSVLLQSRIANICHIR